MLQKVEALSTYIVDGQLPVAGLEEDGRLVDIVAVCEEHAASPLANSSHHQCDTFAAMTGTVEKLTDADTGFKLMIACLPRPQVRFHLQAD